MFNEKKLCYNCGREGHGANYCLCDTPSLNVPIDATVLTAYKSEEHQSLLAIILLKIQKVILWACLDTASRRNFISREEIKKLSLKAKGNESRQFVNINAVQKQSMSIFEVRLKPLNNRTSEPLEITFTQHNARCKLKHHCSFGLKFNVPVDFLSLRS